MKKNLILFFILFFITTVNAKTVYVTDSIKYTFRSEENSRSRILKMIPSGTMLTLIEENKDTGYSKARLNNGMEGFFITRHTQDKPISKWYLNKANKKLDLLQKKYNQIKQKITQLKDDNNSIISANKSLVKERDKLTNGFNELRKTAANAIQTKQQRNQLQKRTIHLEKQLQQIKNENQTLEYNTNQNWFLYGGLLSLFGVVLGFILPKISWGRNRSWDTFPR